MKESARQIGLGLLIVGGLLGLTAVFCLFTIFWNPIGAIDGLLLRGIPAAGLIFAGMSLRKPRT